MNNQVPDNVTSPDELDLLYKQGQFALWIDDLRAAVEFFRAAAERGHARSQGALGVFLMAGLGCSVDAREGMKWLRAAAKQGDEQTVAVLYGRVDGFVGRFNNQPSCVEEWPRLSALPTQPRYRFRLPE